MAKIDFDPKNYNFFCEVCDTHVLKNTKHCQRCNRCSYEFDHHCVWVSNDIGLHNYIDFMRMLTAVFFTVISHFTLCVYTLATLKNISNEAYVGYMTRKSLESLNWATIAILVILAILDTYLLIFHVYLICINTSTYKHMRRKQKRGKSRIIVELENQDENADQEQSGNANSFSINTSQSSVSNKRKPRRITFKDVYCCGPKSNPILNTVKRRTKVKSPSHLEKQSFGVSASAMSTNRSLTPLVIEQNIEVGDSSRNSKGMINSAETEERKEEICNSSEFRPVANDQKEKKAANLIWMQKMQKESSS